MWKKNYLVFVLVTGCVSLYHFKGDISNKETVLPSSVILSVRIGRSSHVTLGSPMPAEKKFNSPSPPPVLRASFAEKENTPPEIPPVFDARMLEKTKEATINRSAVIDQRFARDPSKRVVEVMNELFQEEIVDAEWAYINEKNIHDFFRGNLKFSTFSPDSVQCKSRSCQVIISSSDKKSGDDIRADIAQQILEKNTNIPTGIMSVLDPETAKLIIYFQEDNI